MQILVGIDGSSAAHAAVELVRTLAWPTGTQLRIAEVVEIDPEFYGSWPTLTYAPDGDLEPRLLRAAEATLADAARELDGGPLRVETALLRGRPADALLGEARRVGADLVVVGSRGHGTLDAMLLGSVSAEIVARSAVPVLVVRSATADRALLAWDGSAAAQAAAQLVEAWPAFRNAHVRVAAVVDRGPWWVTVPPIVPAETLTLFEDAWEAAERKAASDVRRLAARLRDAGIDADETVLAGDPGPALVQAARDSRVDLVVMGTHGRHGLARLVLGSVARTLVLHAPASVLVVPDPAAVPSHGEDREPAEVGR